MVARALLAVLLTAAPASWAGNLLDHDSAQTMRRRGEIVAVENILQRHRSLLADRRILEIELEEEDRLGLVYEFKLLDRNGRVQEYYFDARSGELLNRSERKNR